LFERFYECIFYLLLIVVSVDDIDIDSIDGFEKGAPGLHPKPKGEESTCYFGDICKMEVSGDYKTLCQRFWMCNNLTYYPELDDTEVRNNRLCCEVSTQILNEF
jgi:hypothetical protein